MNPDDKRMVLQIGRIILVLVVVAVLLMVVSNWIA